VEEKLTAEERAILDWIAGEGKPVYGRRARLLLLCGQGLAPRDIGPQVGLSVGRVYYWLRAFRERRMGVFPAKLLAAATSAEPLSVKQPSVEPTTKGPSSEPLTAEVVTEPESAEVAVEAERGELPTRLAVNLMPEKPPEHPGLSVDDAMAEAARKTLYFHFQRMLYHEPGTRLGEDIEEVHDMRVATRRMRAAFRVFDDHLDMKQLKPILKDLRRTGRRLGAVRDLDVFWEKTQRYLDMLPPEQQGDLDPLREAWEAERERAREEMLAYLDSDRYARFKERFGEFLQTPSAGTLPTLSKKGEAVPHRLRHVVPVAVYQRLAAVQAYDEWVTRPDVPLERLHRLRIAAKRLRYTLEFFQEVLAPEAKGLIKEMKRLQDHLGDLQDAVVASNLLRDFLTWGTWGHAQAQKKKAPLPVEPVVAPGVAAYLAARQTEIQHLLETFPQVWAYFQSPEFSRSVVLAVAPL
jgi:CHAD domain-containing protein